MPLGIVSPEQFEAELNKSNPPINSGEVIEINRGRPEGALETPEIIRSIIGESALEDGSKLTKETLAKYLSISSSSVSAYKNGATSTSTYNNSNPELGKKIKKRKNIIVGKAKSVMTGALDSLLLPGKMREVKAVELSQIAKNMSAVIRDMEPSDESNRSALLNQQIVIYSPKIMSDESAMEKFPVIEVQE